MRGLQRDAREDRVLAYTRRLVRPIRGPHLQREHAIGGDRLNQIIQDPNIDGIIMTTPQVGAYDDIVRTAQANGIPVATNQVSFSLLDRRAAGRMSALCREAGVKLLAYGTLAGGFLADRLLGIPEPKDIPDWSKSK